ncbi:MAG: hypothetical protein ACLU38_04855 [Dysosmobacter sp.]
MMENHCLNITLQIRKRLKRIVCYLMSTERDTQIRRQGRAPIRLILLHFTIFASLPTPTEIIPEEWWSSWTCIEKKCPVNTELLYDLFMNTGLRLKEVYLLEEDCIEESRYPNVCQLKYIPHKTLSARHRRGAGDYHRIMIPKDIAGRLSQHIIEDAEERENSGDIVYFPKQKVWSMREQLLTLNHLSNASVGLSESMIYATKMENSGTSPLNNSVKPWLLG